MSINPDTLVAAIEVEALPDSTAKTVVLPGAAQDPRNLLSEKQLRVIAGYVAANFDGTLTWADAVARLRTAAGVRGRQLDFSIIDYVIAQLRKQTAGTELSVGQEKLVDSCMRALSQVDPHFDSDIRERIAVADPTLRTSLLHKFIAIRTRGDLDSAMRAFTNLFGAPKFGGELHREVNDADLNISLGAVAPQKSF